MSGDTEVKTQKWTKGTPGPWETDGAASPYKYHEGEHYFQIDAPTPKGADPKLPYTIADTSNRHHCITPEEDAANALLISKAPEMADLLRRAHLELGSEHGTVARPHCSCPLCSEIKALLTTLEKI